ncbi:MAG: energy-converting hydrogenase subunit [Streptosporangiaceae bacterium]|jgi:energy-converting hydrogenase B subunit D|nr:hypothetical protein [Streptosporangiaceae bacterium]MDX6433220.1 energy-converting hydrogenase subunit [Streptosporangiaceae bacterium]
MRELLVAGAMILVVVMATAVVLTRDPVRQAIVLSGYGIAMGIAFVVLQAPDVAMSQIGVGTVIVPLLVVLAITAIARVLGPDDREERRR